MMRKTLLLLLCFAFVACSPSGPSKTRADLTGSQQERVVRATAILAKYCRFPGPLLDAHMAEDVQNNSDGLVPGPSDSWLSGVIVISAADLPKWRDVLSPPKNQVRSGAFTSPLTPPAWWPASGAFEGFEFYSPEKLTGRFGGFVALSPSASTIYFSTY